MSAGTVPGGLGRRAAELAAASGTAALAAGTAQRRSVTGAAASGAVVGILGVLLVSALAYRYESLPALVAGAQHERWWLIAGASWMAAVWTWRDPAR